jgi:hypothetical protein
MASYIHQGTKGGEIMENGKHVGQCLQDSYEDALTDWCSEYAVSTKLPDLYAEKVREATITAQLKNGGRMNVQVTIVAQKPWQNIVAMFRYARKNGYWIRVRSTTSGR